MANTAKVLVVDQNPNCLSCAQAKAENLGIQIDSLRLPEQPPTAIEKVKHIAEEFARVFYEMYLAAIADNYDYILLDSDWFDVISDGCRYCDGAFKVLEKLHLVKLIKCNGIERPTFAQALEQIATA
jgi:uncharacterized protein (DUF1499 family)